MPAFDANRTYDPKRDVRDQSRLLELLESPGPNGVLWPLVDVRRSGKTWTLKALEYRLGKRAYYLDLRLHDEDFLHDGSLDCECLLLDEPGHCLKNVAGFVQRCTELSRHRHKILLTLTPLEWEQLREADECSARVSDKDLRFLPPLDDKEAKALAKRSPRARKLLPALPRD